MKKLAYALLLLSFSSFAQLQPGYHPEQGYAYEDFGTADEYPNLKWSNLGTHSYTIDSSYGLVNPVCVKKLGSYSFNLERLPTTKVGSLTINQAYGSYDPVLLDFGTDPNGKKYTLDLSHNNAFLSFQIKNTSDSIIKIWLYVYDSTGHKVNSVGKHTRNQDYLDFTWFDILPNETLTKVIDFNADAYESLFDTSNCNSGFTLGRSMVFKSSIVSGIGITVINYKTNANDMYKSFKLRNVGLEIKGLGIGSPVIINTLPQDKPSGSISFYPNPATEKIFFTERLENIVLKDMAGNIALLSESASELNLSMLPKGVYILSSSNLTKPNKIIVR